MKSSCYSLLLHASLIWTTVLSGFISAINRNRIMPHHSLNNRDQDTYERYYSKRCTKEQKDHEGLAWAEAGYLAQVHNKWEPTKGYQAAQYMYVMN